MNQSISKLALDEILLKLSAANKAFYDIYPGDRSARQPVHTVYGGADLFTHDIVSKMGKSALRSFLTYAPDFLEMERAIGLSELEIPIDENEKIKLRDHFLAMPAEKRRTSKLMLPYTVYTKVIDKLNREPLEDFRIDFEDGFGNRSWEEEDEVAKKAAEECAVGMEMELLPPFIGIRIKPFTEELKIRGIRTLDIFLTHLLKRTKGKLPENFVVMLPKVSITEQVEALVSCFEEIEHHHNMIPGSLKMEMMVETTQAIMNADGLNPLRKFVLASKGRMIATAFGTYDYTASSNITAKYQDMGHDVCDFAHQVMKVALGGTGIWLSDGATNVMPIGPHRGDLSIEQLAENRSVVHRNWKIAFNHTRHSLYKGIYQGWDLNPAQFPMRYAAVYSFFLESYEEATERLKIFVERAARATLTGDVFDDAATGQGLLNYFLRGLNCGALTHDDAMATGLTLEEFKTRSFLRILEGRRKLS